MNTKRITIGYTIHNKSHLIPRIVEALEDVVGKQDEVIFLFDACDDDSLEVFIKEIYGKWGLKKSYVRDIAIPAEEELFEVKANNRILKEAEGEVIALFQDDMVCKDRKFIEKALNVIDFYGDKLGLMGGREGFELRSTNWPEEPEDIVYSWSHSGRGSKLSHGEFAEKTFLNRGPLVFTRKLLDRVGYLDEEYEPLWGDDLDYCARCKFEHDLTNVVFQCDIQSPLSWGTTRKGTKLKKRLNSIMMANWHNFTQTWGEYLDK